MLGKTWWLVVAVFCCKQNADPDSMPDSTIWQAPMAPAAGERVREREHMVLTQIAAQNWSSDAVSDKAVLQAMRAVPRHAFVPEDLKKYAYENTPLPIGHGQTISQPYLVAKMTELLKISPRSKVLEVGTGSGYQAAVLAQLTPHVYTIEIVKPLAKLSSEVLRKEGGNRVETKYGDGYFGWPQEAPFDAIIVTCAAGHLPPPLWKQLKPRGRIVIPIGGIYSVQRLVVVEKTEDGQRRSHSVMGVRFVPMTGRGLQD